MPLRAVKSTAIYIIMHTYIVGTQSVITGSAAPTPKVAERLLCYVQDKMVERRTGRVESNGTSMITCDPGSKCYISEAAILISTATGGQNGIFDVTTASCIRSSDCYPDICQGVITLGRYLSCQRRCCDSDLCNNVTGDDVSTSARNVSITDSTSAHTMVKTRVPLSPKIGLPIATTSHTATMSTSMNGEDRTRLLENSILMYSFIAVNVTILISAAVTVIWWRRKRLKKKKNMFSPDIFSIAPYAQVAASLATGATNLDQHKERETMKSARSFSNSDRADVKASQHHIGSTMVDETKNSYHQIGGVYEIPLPSQRNTDYILPKTVPFTQREEVCEMSQFVQTDQRETRSRQSGPDSAFRLSEEASTSTDKGYLTPIKKSSANITISRSTSTIVEPGYLSPINKPSANGTVGVRSLSSTGADGGYLIPIKRPSLDNGSGYLVFQ